MKTGIFGLVAFAAVAAQAENWPQWRGIESDGVALTRKVPARLVPGENLAWKMRLPGRGCSTPVVWEDRIFVTCAIDGADGVLAIDWRGKEVWRRSFGSEAATRHRNAGSASNPSVATDGRHLFAYYKSGTLAGLTMDGGVAWTRNLQEDYAPDGLKWDLGTSPMFAGGHLVVAMMHNKHPSFLLAFDKATGKEVWKVARDMNAPAEANDAYTTPFVRVIDGRETIVVWGGDHLTGHDAATGSELWRHGNFNPDQIGNWRVIASAAATDGVAIVPFGRGGFVGGVQLGGRGDTTKSRRLWTVKGVGADSSTPAAHDGKFYVLADRGRSRGQVTCLDAGTGKKDWQTTLPKSASSYYASPTVVGDRLCCVREDGVVFMGKMTPNGLVDVRESKLDDRFIASPVAVDGKLLLRGFEWLWCFE